MNEALTVISEYIELIKHHEPNNFLGVLKKTTATFEGFRPDFHHFEIVCEGILPLMIPSGGRLREYELKDFDVFYMVPGACSQRRANTYRKLFVINFHPDSIECYVSTRQPDMPENTVPRISLTINRPLNSGALYILKAFEAYSSEGRHDMQKKLFKVLLDELAILIADSSSTTGQSELSYRKVLRYIQENACSNINRNSSAWDLGVSPDYISYLFRRHSKKGFNECLLSMRIDSACEMLRHTDDTIYRIAISCGFSDSAYFIKVFKRFRAMTPLAYRQSLAYNKS